MARFDVYRFTDTTPLVVDIQAELFSELDSRVVVPLRRVEASRREHLVRLKPVVRVEAAEYHLITTDIVSIPSMMLGEHIANIDDQRHIIVDAIDFLMQGY